MLEILSICNSSTIVQIIYIVKIIVNIITIIVPIMLLLSCMITAVKEMIDANNTPGNILKTISIRAVAAILIFYIPNLVFIVVNIVGSNEEVKTCYQKASMSEVKRLRQEEEALEKLAQDKWNEAKRKQEEARKKLEEEKKYQQTQDQIDTSNQVSGNATQSYNIVSVNTTDLGCTVYYSDHATIFKSLRFNASVANQVHNILTNVCSYSNRTPWITQLETAGAYVNKGGKHGEGVAIDLFNRWSYNNGSKSYGPYGSQGYSTWNNYTKFICEVCGGKEDCQYNINYQIYKRYFMGNGWCWGGLWTPDVFDPMHFEVSGHQCGLPDSGRIKCGG